MFSENLTAILRTLDARRAPAFRAAATRAARAEQEARRVLGRAPEAPPLSERRADPARYQALALSRRRDLETLLLAGTDAGGRVLDLVCLICEESRWAAGPGEPFEDEAHPDIDLQAADTAALLGWACRFLGDEFDRISPRVRARMLFEARRRVLSPLLANDDYLCSTAVLCSAATALVLLESDRARLAAALKPLLRMLDATYACAKTSFAPLCERLADACAIADFALLLKRVTAGAADFTREAPYAAWLDELLFAHVSDDWFFSCTDGVCRPALSGQALFRLGRMSGDDALQALGAALHRAHALPSPTSTGRLLDAACAEALDAVAVPAPRLKHAALEDGRLLIARGAGFFCGLTGGGNRGNVGDICVFLDRTPVLTGGNLPLAQLPRPLSAPAPDWDFSHDARAIMGMDVTPAYPPEAGIRAHQRTLVLSREEYGAQLLDVFDLEKPVGLRYAFHTPFLPEFFEGGARLGPLLLRWEGAPQTDARRLAAEPDFPDGQWELTLCYPQAEHRAMHTFFMRHA